MARRRDLNRGAALSTESLPAPHDDAAPAKVTFQDLFDAMDSERTRALALADICFGRASASDQQSERERDADRKAGRRYLRVADVWTTAATMVARASKSPEIIAEFRKIAQREAVERAELEAEADQREALR